MHHSPALGGLLEVLQAWFVLDTAGLHAAHLFCWQAAASADTLRAEPCGAGRLSLHRGLHLLASC